MIKIKKAVTVMMCVFMAVILSSCGSSELVGKWQAAALISDKGNTEADFARTTGLPIGTAYQIEFRKNGTGTIRYYYDLAAEEFTWNKKDGKVFINDYDVFEYSIKDGRLETNYVYQLRFGAADSIYDKYCNYSFDDQIEVDTVILERVDGFESSDRSHEIALTRIAGFVCAEADSLGGLPSGAHSFSMNDDAGGSAVNKKISQLLKNHGLEAAAIELTIENDRCVRVKLTDSNGNSGVYNAHEAAAAINSQH